jgi:hypothetical protein
MYKLRTNSTGQRWLENYLGQHETIQMLQENQILEAASRYLKNA